MPGLLDIGSLLGGLLGGQAPQQQQQQQTLPGYGGGNNLTAGLANLTQGGGSPAGSIFNAILGLTTGQRTDPVGAYQQMANMTYRALKQLPNEDRTGPLLTDAQAQLGAVDPNVQKEIIGRMFPHYKFENINGTLVATEPNTGKILGSTAYTAPRDITYSNEQGIKQMPGLVGGVPQGVPPQRPIAISPLSPPLPGSAAGTPGTTGSTPPSVPSATTGAPLGGGTPQSTLPPATPGVPTGAPPPPTVGGPGAGGAIDIVVPKSPGQIAKEREIGTREGAGQVDLSKAEQPFRDTIGLIDRVGAHAGKAGAVGRAYGYYPTTMFSGQAGDFARLLDQLATDAASKIDPKATEKNKWSITGLDRRVEPAQFDAQLAALRQTMVDKIKALYTAAGQPPPEFPTPSPAGPGAVGTSAAGQGAPDGGWINVGKGRVRVTPGQ